MDIKNQIIHEYLATGCSYRKLSDKYGFSRATICNWVKVHQGIHNLPPTDLQQNHYFGPMEKKRKNKNSDVADNEAALLERIASLEKQLKHEQLKAEVLDTLINVAEKQLSINIRKKPGTQQSSK